YLLIQWLLLLGSIYLLVSGVKDHNKRIIIWIMGLIFISSTYFWRLHVERGQVYILNVFLIALSYRLARSNKTALMTLAGLIFGFAVSLRPPLLLFGIPVLFFRKWKLLLGGIIGLPLGIFLPGIQSGHLYWSSYFSAMKIHALAHLGELRMIYSQNQLYNIEGITNWEAAKLPIEDSSLLNLFKYYLRIPLYPYILEIIFLILLVMMLVFIINKKKFTAGMDFVFLWGVLFVFLADFFIPAARYSYNNVIWLPVFALIIISERRLTENRFLLILLSLGLLFSVAFTYYALTPLISDYFILIFSVYYCMKLSEVHAEK
ncbi:MAG: DUF2029 domain-containing protein, partial [Candidatus Cloacimonetes bacterium]|nr:DUF2029 domain-containing protein [Candidatus Cloacimonadota bacterium]